MSVADLKARGAFLAVLMGTASVCAAQAERLRVEGTDTFVEPPAGWMLAPMSSDPPAIMLRLCDPAEKRGCQVRAELMLSTAPDGPEQRSLDETLVDAMKQRSQYDSEPSRLKVGRFDAVEIVTKGPHSSHIPMIVNRGILVMDAEGKRYECMLTAQPDTYRSLTAVFRSFCGSLSVGEHKPH